MDIKITESQIRHFLETKATAEVIAEKVSLCGPTIDRLHQKDEEILFEIEVITNRIDTASALGFARESAVILNQFGIEASLKNDPYQNTAKINEGLHQSFHFEIEKDTVSRFVAVAIEGLRVSPSDPLVSQQLDLCGIRPINNLVDITNELVLLYGLPTHIFDLDKLATQKLSLRNSRKGEIIATLDGSKNTLKGDDLVIEDHAGRLVDLCGIMGGEVAEVDTHTTSILFIAPVYDRKKVRRTSLYLQKRTLASQIFEKKPDQELCLHVLREGISLFEKRAGGKVSSKIFDYYPERNDQKKVLLDLDWLNHFVGISLPQEKSLEILTKLGFKTKNISEQKLETIVPSWRYDDISTKEDLAEEIVRVYGYYNLPPIMPQTNLPPQKRDSILQLEAFIKNHLSAKGFNEVFNNSLISTEIIKKSGLDENQHLKLRNALSSDYEFLRTTLAPSLAQNLYKNQNKVELPIKLFEVANTYIVEKGKTLPIETPSLALISTEEFFIVKGEIENLLTKIKARDFTFSKEQDPPSYFDKNSTASIEVSQQKIGFLGTFSQETKNAFKIETNPTIFEVALPWLSKSLQENYQYQKISDFPPIINDLTISSSESVGAVIGKIKSCSSLIKEVLFKGSFQDKKTFQIYFESSDRNLTQNEVDSIKEKINQAISVGRA